MRTHFLEITITKFTKQGNESDEDRPNLCIIVPLRILSILNCYKLSPVPLRNIIYWSFGAPIHCSDSLELLPMGFNIILAVFPLCQITNLKLCYLLLWISSKVFFTQRLNEIYIPCDTNHQIKRETNFLQMIFPYSRRSIYIRP